MPSSWSLDSIDNTWLLLSTSSISVISCLFVILVYCVNPQVRKFPSNLAFYRTLCDLIFSLQFFILNTSSSSWSPPSPETCAEYAFWTQFSLFGSLSWFFIESVNVFFSVRNPFRRPHTRNMSYHVWVWLGSYITARLIDNVDLVGYRPGLEFCYTKINVGSLNLSNWTLLYFWIIVYWLLTCCSVIYSTSQLSKSSMERTLETRVKTIQRGIASLCCFSIVWGIAFVLWVASFIYERQNRSSTNLLVALSFLLNANGFLDCAVWIATHWSSYKEILCCENESKRSILAVDSSRTLLRKDVVAVKDISSALRREFIQNITHVIRNSLSLAISDQFPEEIVQFESRKKKKRFPLEISIREEKMEEEEEEEFEQDDDKEDKERYGLINEESSVIEEKAKLISKDSVKTCTLQLGKGKFYEYFPQSFATLRNDAFDTPPELFIRSFPADCDTLEERFSEGASGSLFFFTADMKFIVKTITKSELNTLKSIFESYFKHLLRHRTKSLVTRFYGLYAIELYSSLQFFVIMENIFWNPENIPVHIRYDLKGSWIDRWSENPNPLKGVMKDNDLHSSFHLEPSRAEKILCQALMDCSFLCSHGIMDYSLLLGVHQCVQLPSVIHCTALLNSEDASPELLKEDEKSTSSSTQGNVGISSNQGDTLKMQSDIRRSRTRQSRTSSSIFYRDFHNGSQVNVIKGDGIYYMGLIDILQKWNLSKIFERLFKVLIKCKDSNGISAVEPVTYANRFLTMLRKRLDVPLRCLESVPEAEVSYVTVSGETVLVRVNYKGLCVDNWEPLQNYIQAVPPEVLRVDSLGQQIAVDQASSVGVIRSSVSLLLSITGMQDDSKTSVSQTLMRDQPDGRHRKYL